MKIMKPRWLKKSPSLPELHQRRSSLAWCGRLKSPLFPLRLSMARSCDEGQDCQRLLQMAKPSNKKDFLQSDEDVDIHHECLKMLQHRIRFHTIISFNMTISYNIMYVTIKKLSHMYRGPVQASCSLCTGCHHAPSRPWSSYRATMGLWPWRKRRKQREDMILQNHLMSNCTMVYYIDVVLHHII